MGNVRLFTGYVQRFGYKSISVVEGRYYIAGTCVRLRQVRSTYFVLQNKLREE